MRLSYNQISGIGHERPIMICYRNTCNKYGKEESYPQLIIGGKYFVQNVHLSTKVMERTECKYGANYNIYQIGNHFQLWSEFPEYLFMPEFDYIKYSRDKILNILLDSSNQKINKI